MRVRGPSCTRPRPSAMRRRSRSPVRDRAQRRGARLEIASGTGQHVVAFARAMPGLTGSRPRSTPARRASIDAYVAEAGCPICARHGARCDRSGLGQGAGGSGADRADQPAASHQHARGAPDCGRGGAGARPGGRFALYGPFLRDGQAISEGDARFHASLTAQDPAIGYKDLAEVEGWLREAGLTLHQLRHMPANNLFLVAERPG